MDCSSACQAISEMLIDDRAPGVDRRQLEAHLASCAECALPYSLVGTPRRRHRRPGVRWLLAAAAMLIVAVVAGPFAYFHVVDGPSPALLTLSGGHGGSTGPIDGNWTLARGSQVDYRVGEVLFGQDHTAVGRSTRVTGSMVINRSTVTAARITVDLGSITSGNAGRDTVFRDHLLETYSHPDGTFVLTRPLELDLIPANGATITVPAAGTLSLRGVTRPVSFPLQAKRDGTGIAVVGTILIRWAQWHIPDPSFAITKVADHGTVELLLAFLPAK